MKLTFLTPLFLCFLGILGHAQVISFERPPNAGFSWTENGMTLTIDSSASLHNDMSVSAANPLFGQQHLYVPYASWHDVHLTFSDTIFINGWWMNIYIGDNFWIKTFAYDDSGQVIHQFDTISSHTTGYFFKELNWNTVKSLSFQIDYDFFYGGPDLFIDGLMYNFPPGSDFPPMATFASQGSIGTTSTQLNPPQQGFPTYSSVPYENDTSNWGIQVSSSALLKEKEWSFYPHPVRDKLTIQGPMEGELIQATVTDLTGKKLIHAYLSSGSNIDLSQLSQGSYLLEIRVGEKAFRKAILKD